MKAAQTWQRDSRPANPFAAKTVPESFGNARRANPKMRDDRRIILQTQKRVNLAEMTPMGGGDFMAMKTMKKHEKTREWVRILLAAAPARREAPKIKNTKEKGECASSRSTANRGFRVFSWPTKSGYHPGNENRAATVRER
ncbi:MAG TPA: hypothetical protein VJL29_02345 [Thermoguttaceae bacterium]|nr:hypothetical protein [Thermoguttaceae bacterium]